MFLEEMMRMMAGPYLSNLIDLYCANQDVLNSIIVGCALLWIIYKKNVKNVESD